MTSQELIKRVLEEAEGNILSALHALEDGEYIASLGVSQEEVEDAYHKLKELNNK